MAERRRKQSAKVNPLPPGSPLGTFVTGGMPQQYVHHTTANIYKHTPLALVGPKWEQLLAEPRSLSYARQHGIAHRGVLTANATAANKCIDVAALHIAYLTEVVKKRAP